MDLGLYCLQVGHGLSLVLLFPHGVAWMFDCGGERRVLEEFLGAHVRRIEHIFLTHAHNDHVRNLEWICRNRHWKIGTVWLPAVTPSIPKTCAESLVRAREEKTIEKIRLAVLDNGMGSTRLLQECKGTSGRDHVIVELLYPTALDSLLGQSHQGSLGGLGSGPNAFSCIYRLVYEGRRILVPGDADMSALRRLALASPERLNCDLLVAPHHGKPQNASASGLSFQDLAALFRSQVAFVSNSSSARKANWPPDDDFIKALAASPTSVVCAELTPTCQCGGMVRGPLGRGARLMGLSNSDRDSRACMGTLRVELRGGTLHYPDLEYHATNIRGNRYIKLAAPCLRADS